MGFPVRQVVVVTSAFLALAISACPGPTLTAEPDPVETPVVNRCLATDVVWEEGPSIAVGVDHHQSFIFESAAGPALYVVGGFDSGRARAEIYRAAINDDGSLQDFEIIGAMPEPRSGAALALINNHVVLAGGFTSTHVATTVVGTIDEDSGSLGTWTTAPDLPGVRFHPSGASSGNRAVVSGGVDGTGDAHDDVFTATIGDDGALSAWETVHPLPGPRSHHASLLEGETFHVIGGLAGNPFRNDTTTYDNVLAASLDQMLDTESAGLSTTTTSSELALTTHAATSLGDCAMIIGGFIGSGLSPTSAVLRMDLSGDTAGAVTVMPTPLPDAAVVTHRHHLPIHGNTLYAIAGRTTTGRGSDRVFIGRLQGL